MMRNRPRGGMAGGSGHGGPGLLGEGPSAGMKRMMTGNGGGGGDGGLLGKGPNQGRGNNQRFPNQGRMQQQSPQNRMQQRPNQDRMPQRSNQNRIPQNQNQDRNRNQPRSLLGAPAIEDQHMRHDAMLGHSQEMQSYGGGGGNNMAEMEYYEEPEHYDAYIEDDYNQGFVDQGNMYDNPSEREHFGSHEQELDYGMMPSSNAGRPQMNTGSAQSHHDLAAMNERKERRSRWDPPRSQPEKSNRPNSRELMGKTSNQGRMQQPARALLDTPFGGIREQKHGQQHGRQEEQSHNIRGFAGHGLMESADFYEEPKNTGGYIEEDPFNQGYELPSNQAATGRVQRNNRAETRSRFDPPRPQQNSMNRQKTKQRELMEKADLQMKLLEEQEKRERMAMLQQQQALIMQQQQQQQQLQMQQQLQQQQKMQLMQQQANMLGNIPSVGSIQGNMASIPSLFDLPSGGKTILGKRANVISRNLDNKKPRNGPRDRMERNRMQSGNSAKKPLASSNRKDYQRNRRDRIDKLRTSAAARRTGSKGDRKNSASGRSRNQGRDRERPRRDSNRERGSNRRSSSSMRSKSKEESENKSKDKPKAEPSATAAAEDKKSEAYDPAEPTGEVIDDKSTVDIDVKVEDDESSDSKDKVADKMEVDKTEEEKKDAEISLTVTVNKKGRSVNDSDKKDDVSDASSLKTKKYKCNVCIVECYDEESFARHMNGKKHREKMGLVMSSTSHQEVLIKSRLQAEEHLRQIEESHKGPVVKPAPKGKALETHCKVCDKKFTGAYKDHKDSTEHKAKEDLSKAGCKICNVTTFNTYHDYRKHLQSDWHKKKENQASWPKCKLCNQKFKSPRKFVQHCKTPHHIQNKQKLNKDDEDEELSELVTLDTVGFEDDSAAEQNKNAVDNEKISEFRKPLPVSSTSSPKPLTRSTSVEDDEIPDVYDSNTAIGKKYIVPVAGFFCKVCHKFYNNETAAKVTHCQSKSHYDKVLNFVNAKKLKNTTTEATKMTETSNNEQTGTQDTSQSDNLTSNGDQSTNDDQMDSSQDSNMEEDAADKESNSSVDTETSPSQSESDCSIIEVEVTEKVVAKPSPKARQQRARRGGAARGRGVRKN